jgi:hypothetical protein
LTTGPYYGILWFRMAQKCCMCNTVQNLVCPYWHNWHDWHMPVWHMQRMHPRPLAYDTRAEKHKTRRGLPRPTWVQGPRATCALGALTWSPVVVPGSGAASGLWPQTTGGHGPGCFHVNCHPISIPSPGTHMEMQWCRVWVTASTWSLAQVVHHDRFLNHN